MRKDWEQMILFHLPWYDKENKTFVNIAKVIDRSFEFHYNNLEIILRNLDLDTAEEMLSTYERHLGIDSIGTLEERRARIRATLNYMHEQTTEAVVNKLVQAYATSSEVEVLRSEIVDTFNIDFVYTGGELNLDNLVKMLDKVLPAHLDYIIRMITRNVINLKEQTKDYLNRFYFTGQHDCGTVPEHIYQGTFASDTIYIPSENSVTEQRGYVTNEINTGGGE